MFDSTETAAVRLPAWLEDVVELEDPEDVTTNRERFGGNPEFDPDQLAVLQDLIDLNGLTEDSALLDYDDGDGILDPIELGFQVWSGGNLVSLTLGPNPHFSFGYGVEALPDSLGALHSLQHLDVQGNRIRALPDAIGDLVALRDLRVRGNGLESLPDAIVELRDLRTLVLSENQLVELPERIGTLEQLESLHLSDNPLGGLPESFADLWHLRELGIAQEQRMRGFEGSAPEGGAWGFRDLPEPIGELDGLETLHLSGNRLGCGGAAAPGLARFIETRDGVRVFGLSVQVCVN